VKELSASSTSLLRGGHSPSGGAREGAEAEEEEEEEEIGGGADVLGGMVRMRDSDVLAPSSSPVLLGKAGTGARTGTGMGRKPLSASCEVEGKDEDKVKALISPPLPCTIRSPSPCMTGAGASMIPEAIVCCCSLAAYAPFTAFFIISKSCPSMLWRCSALFALPPCRISQCDQSVTCKISQWEVSWDK
jgi:hypothetical protein